ncbi:mitochondrial carrier domain-containing protein [Hysterangium stoloniferum]|nr:mitochondrial carrier domain-containing protein [Hysterangium stoloniferum]
MPSKKKDSSRRCSRPPVYVTLNHPNCQLRLAQDFWYCFRGYSVTGWFRRNTRIPLLRLLAISLGLRLYVGPAAIQEYDFFKAELLRRDICNDNIYCHFTASFAAGTVATTVCSPADVLKSRIMNASGPGSNSTIQVIRNSMATEGPMFIFKGWVPAWSRLQPTTILIFLTFEQLKNLVDWSRSKGIDL